MVKKNFYAVVRGWSTGVFNSWAECQENTQGFQDNQFQGFATRKEALEYLHQHMTAQEEEEDENTPSKRPRIDESSSPAATSGLTAEASRLDVSSPSSPEVVGVRTLNQTIQEKFDEAQARGQVLELLSPARPTGRMDDDGGAEQDFIATTESKKDVSENAGNKHDKEMDNVKIKMDSDAKGVEHALYPPKQIKTLQGEKKARITEVLGALLELKIREADSSNEESINKTERRMEGDIPQLGLHKQFFVRGVRVGWPYPVIMQPQKQMVNHVIMALKRKLSVVIESPTGTGKSAALLCAVLSWQRWHAKCSETKPPTIYYCSRTHSQVEQMVASLKKTPYRPRMSVLGSRESLCIHREIKPRDGSSLSRPVSTNLACQTRVKNTEKYRKNKLGSYESPYDDDNPPVELPSDGIIANTVEDENEAKKPTCSHYRQLTRSSLAARTQTEFAPSQDAVNCCSIGGERTKLGAFDIEDLVSFGMNPNVHNAAIYRGASESFGLLFKGEKGDCKIREVEKDGAAEYEGTLRPGDTILQVNGKNMRQQGATAVMEAYRTSEDPLGVQVTRNRDGPLDDDRQPYSHNAACPYYLSRALAKKAEIVFCPYNYLLDPIIRDAVGIDLSDSIVVLDEAHNVEGTLCEGGSGSFYELELLELMVLLERQSQYKGNLNEEGVDLGEAAHELLIFLERITLHMNENKKKFENNPGISGANFAISESKKYHYPDNKEFEIDYFGPTGHGVSRKAVGCKPFFDRIGDCGLSDSGRLLQCANHFANEISGSEASEEGRRESTLCDLLVELISKLSLAVKSPENFYISTAARANGSLSYASGASEESDSGRRPSKVPSVTNSDSSCSHPRCAYGPSRPVFHCASCNGSTPRWEAVLSLQLLNPGLLLVPIALQCRSLIFASGSLAPLGSFCSELGLSAASDEDHTLGNSRPAASDKASLMKKESGSSKCCAKLQVKPPPLEANHVVDLDKQLRCVSIGMFPDGSPLTTTYNNYKKDGFFPALGDALATVVEAVPWGGVLVFVPSYSFLRSCLKAWQRRDLTYQRGDRGGDVWDRFHKSKGTVVVEPSGSPAAFDIAKERYTEGIRRDGKALLLAVFRGKMSEGISFNDDNARAVVCVGLPFPNSHDRNVKAKKAFNDEMRSLCGNKNLLPGNEWYSQQAYRAIAQALGRCLRHAGDYGTVILMDSRHCDDGAPVEGLCRAHRNLPKWMRHCVRNLSINGPRPDFRDANPPIFNGYAGLAPELKEFFTSAREHSLLVMEKFKKEFEDAQARDGVGKRSFNREKGTWT